MLRRVQQELALRELVDQLRLLQRVDLVEQLEQAGADRDRDTHDDT